jgi:hypothetical protein
LAVGAEFWLRDVADLEKIVNGDVAGSGWRGLRERRKAQERRKKSCSKDFLAKSHHLSP